MRIRSCLMPTTTQSSRLGMHDAVRRAADAGRRKERQTDLPSAPRSRQEMVFGERALVKAGLRPPPPAASALTRLRSPTSRAAQEIEGRERASSQSQRFPATRNEKKRGALLTKKPPYEPGHDDGASDVRRPVSSKGTSRRPVGTRNHVA